MFIDLQRVPHDGKTVDLTVPADQLNLDNSEFRLLDRVRMAGRLDRVDEAAFRLRGSLAATLELDCVRCLESFQIELTEALDLLFLPSSANVAPESPGRPDRLDRLDRLDKPDRREEGRELAREDLAASFYQDDRIEVKQLVREQVYLALPMKPICGSECRGLCPECGTNLNLSSCSCVREKLDPRLATLKTLLKS